MSTYTAKAADIKRKWHVIDASGQPLGRLATRVALLLRGKHKPIYSPHLDTGDFVVILNAEKVAVTGQKASKKVYYHHSMYPGGLKAVRLREMMAKHPERVIEKAVKGMLPKGALGKQIYSKLKVYAGDEHPHTAQVNAGAAQARRAERAAAAEPTPAPKPARATKAKSVAPVAEPIAVEPAGPAAKTAEQEIPGVAVQVAAAPATETTTSATAAEPEASTEPTAQDKEA